MSAMATQIISLAIVYSRRRSKKTSKLRVTGLCEKIHRWPVNFPHKGPVTQESFPFDDAIMQCTWYKFISRRYSLVLGTNLCHLFHVHLPFKIQTPHFCVDPLLQVTIMLNDIGTAWDPWAFCNMGYPSEMHRKPKSHIVSFPITSFSVTQSFRNFAQSTAMIRLNNKLWANEIARKLSLRCVSDGCPISLPLFLHPRQFMEWAFQLL